MGLTRHDGQQVLQYTILFVAHLSYDSLAGMIHKVGLLPACNHQQVPFAYKMYSQADDEGWKLSNGFKKTFSIDVNIEFLGVWYVYGSLITFATDI